MDDKQYEEWLSKLTIVHDEAYLPGEELVNDRRRRFKRPKAKTEEERRARMRESSRLHMRRVRERQYEERRRAKG